jgi:hypothetical protein
MTARGSMSWRYLLGDARVSGESRDVAKLLTRRADSTSA